MKTEREKRNGVPQASCPVGMNVIIFIFSRLLEQFLLCSSQEPNSWVIKYCHNLALVCSFLCLTW